MEVAKNPTDKNIRNWLLYLKRKNELASKLQSRVSSYLSKEKVTLKQKSQIFSRAKLKKTVAKKRFVVRMYFSSTCPHCKKMLVELKDLQLKGYYVEAYQIDDMPMKNGVPLVVRKANPKQVKKLGISSVPYTLVADLKTKKMSEPIKGFHSKKQMETIIRSIANLN